MLNIVGGTYWENCIDPNYRELYGSGLRAAAALSNKDSEISFYSCISEKDKSLAEYKSRAFGYKINYLTIPSTIEFDYYHPLSVPNRINYNEDIPIQEIIINEEGNYLYYGMLEANAKFHGNYVVYDPQNHKKFEETGATAKHLAIVLNKSEALLLSSVESMDLVVVGNDLLDSEKADVVVIKNGAYGALVFEKAGVSEVPVFQTNYVWPIGSGDVFSAIFSWEWIIQKKTPRESALYASMMTAQYCQSKHLPIRESIYKLNPIKKERMANNVYLAGPFFTISERWLINELRNILIDFGNNVFSPYHDVGVIGVNDIYLKSGSIADQDLNGLKQCNVVLAIISGLDAGTLFEIGYAIALKKKVVVLSENINENDLTMLIGSKCEITDDLSTAVYKVSWT